MKGMLAKSKAGHDKDRIYLVLSQEGDMVSLVNGVNRTIERPKRKKRMHIQPIVHLPREVADMMEELSEITDETVVKILDAYARRIGNVKGRCH